MKVRELDASQPPVLPPSPPQFFSNDGGPSRIVDVTKSIPRITHAEVRMIYTAVCQKSRWLSAFTASAELADAAFGDTPAVLGCH